MEAEMWTHPATRRNAAQIQADGVTVAGPVSGRHASGEGGEGRMLEPEALIGHIRLLLGKDGDLAGTRCMVTAGGTREPLDPVRVLGNRSSGKMGVALARAARDRGAAVTLITTAAPPPDDAGFDVQSVSTAAEMYAAVTDGLQNQDLLLMAAAVADYRPAAAADRKIKKSDRGDHLGLDLERTEDIVAAAAQQRRRADTRSPAIVAFAAETEKLEQRARAKLADKGVDLVVGNLISGGEGQSVFGSNNNEVLLVAPEQDTVALPAMAKEQVAHHILDAARKLIAQ
jgi:phosphopantothenoylcysteine decarboxylase/phosphopantothenate--cysteine ligase